VLIGQVIVKFALFATFAGMAAVLLPLLVAGIDPEGKVGALAAIMTAGAITNALSQPVVGAFSDRTRTRFGRRLPWMVGGSLVGGLALGLTGDATSLLVLGLLWVLVQFALNGLEVSMDAYLVDAFPPARRGFAAGVVGLALVGGTSAGALLTGFLAGRPSVATWILAGLIALSVVIFAVLVRDGATPPQLPSRRALDAVRALWKSVAAHPDFIKILLWRIGYGIAYGSVFAYLLYIVTDLIGASELEAAKVVALLTVVAGVSSAVSVILGGWLSDRLQRRRLFLLIGNAAIVTGNVLLIVRPSVPTAIVTALLFGAGLGLAISCGRALASQVLPSQEHGAATGLGVLSTAASIGQAAAPAIGAFAIALGGYPAVFVVSIAGAALCSVAVVFVKTVR
jgi:MFS family permease